MQFKKIANKNWTSLHLISHSVSAVGKTQQDIRYNLKNVFWVLSW